MIERISPMRRFSPVLTFRTISRQQTRQHKLQSLITVLPPCRLRRINSHTLTSIHRTQIRTYATPTTSGPPLTPPHVQPQAPPPPPPPPPPPRSLHRFTRPILYAGLFLLIGSTLGRTSATLIAPAPAPLPNTPADILKTQQIQLLASHLPLVQTLSASPAWRSWPAYSGLPPAHLRTRLTSGPLAGSRGLGAYQQVFHCAESGEWVSVVWIGEATAGWPGVAHGGLLATLLDESLGRCAIAGFREKTAVTANLDVDYVRPVRTEAFSVLRVRRMEGNAGEAKVERKAWVEATLEDLKGNVLVKAKGLFVVPRNLRLPTLPDEVF